MMSCYWQFCLQQLHGFTSPDHNNKQGTAMHWLKTFHLSSLKSRNTNIIVRINWLNGHLIYDYSFTCSKVGQYYSTNCHHLVNKSIMKAKKATNIIDQPWDKWQLFNDKAPHANTNKRQLQIVENSSKWHGTQTHHSILCCYCMQA